MIRTAACLAAVLVATTALAAPEAVRPTDPDTVLSRASPAGPARGGAGAPAEARRLISAARDAMDPRLYGYAEARIAAGLETAPDDPELLTLRAVVRQARHDFAGAIADLDRVLAHRPEDRQARLSRAFLAMTTGDLAAARSDCAALPRRSGHLVRAACAARLAELTGRAGTGAALLGRALSSGRGDTRTRAWSHEILSGILSGLGRHAEAAAHLAHAIRLTGPSPRLRLRRAAALRAGGDPGSALEALAELDTDAALVERARARLALGRPAEAETAALRARFADAARRGDVRHWREEAAFTLHVLGDTDRALTLATRNWALQKEPEDRALLAEATAAAEAAEAAGKSVLREGDRP